jgi:hypothetical protein
MVEWHNINDPLIILSWTIHAFGIASAPSQTAKHPFFAFKDHRITIPSQTQDSSARGP